MRSCIAKSSFNSKRCCQRRTIQGTLPARREADIRADWIGFEIPDEFVVGYGIDYAQRNRNLPYIGKVRFTDP